MMHSRYENTNPAAHSKRAAAIDEYLNPPHPKFPKGTRVIHQFRKVPGTVIGNVRDRGAGYAMDVEVRFDDGYQDYCHLGYMTPLLLDAAEVYNNAFKGAAPVPPSTGKVELAREDQATKKLLNELYHDRARLERVVKEANRLILDSKEWLKANTKWKEITAEGTGLANLIGGLAGWLRAHADE